MEFMTSEKLVCRTNVLQTVIITNYILLNIKYLPVSIW